MLAHLLAVTTGGALLGITSMKTGISSWSIAEKKVGT
jgi:hypothetical protein